MSKFEIINSDNAYLCDGDSCTIPATISNPSPQKQLDSININDLENQNRLVMSPMTVLEHHLPISDDDVI